MRSVLLHVLGLSVLVSAAAAQTNEEKLACKLAAEQGQADRNEGRLLDARTQLLQCASDTCPAFMREYCDEWLRSLEPRIPSIVVRVVDQSNRDLTNVVATLDGAPIELDGRELALDPGVHRVQVQATGTQTVERVILAAERESARLVRIELEIVSATAPITVAAPAKPAPNAANEPAFRVPTGAWIAGGVGLAALGSFSYFAIDAGQKYDTLKQRCSPHCSDAQARPGRNAARAADISLAVGGAALAAGVLWSLLAQGSETTPPQRSAALMPTRDGFLCTVSSVF